MLPNRRLNKGRLWSRNELLIAFNLYCLIPFGKIDGNNKKIIALANLLKRTPSAVSMKLANFSSLDPFHKARSIKGLKNVSKLDRLIWQEFHEDWEDLAFESQKIVKSELDLKSPSALELWGPAAINRKSEAVRMTRVRLVQDFFRDAVLTSYQNKCAVCQINLPELLNASHIIPWSKNKKRRADPTNGISLCTLHDRAFDRGLITIDTSFHIVISERIRYLENTNLVKVAFHDLDGELIYLPVRFGPDPMALQFHRQSVFCE